MGKVNRTAVVAICDEPVNARCESAWSWSALRWTECCCSSSVARNLQWRGLFWRLETKSHDLDPHFDWSSQKLRRFFLPKIRYSPKKKVFIQALSEFFWSISHKVLYQFSSPIPLGGAIFVCSGKFGLKSAKSRVFCILFRPMGGLEPPRPPLATLLCCCLEEKERM